MTLPGTTTVGVVIPTFNHARFLGDALASVMAQTRPADEVVVVDDGSNDDPAAVVERFPKARLVRQDNRGLAAARNAGLAAIGTDLVLFLDADDVLPPAAIESNLRCFAGRPDAGFVYGAHTRVDARLKPTLGPCYDPAAEEPLATFLQRNAIGMHAAVLYSTARLRAVGGFDPSLKACEDYDVYLKMAKLYPVASHDEVVALYRIHGANMSSNAAWMLGWALKVHSRHKPAEPAALASWKRGRRTWRGNYADMAIDGPWGAEEGGSILAVLRILPRAPRRLLRRASAALAKRAARLIGR